MNYRASVIVRSYNRLPALCELLENLLSQDYHSFEIIVVEQSDKYSNSDKQRLLELCSDVRVKLMSFKPLGGPKARNEGVKNASGDILIVIDDDDIPTDDQWIKRHMEAYTDQNLIGLTGRHLFDRNKKCPYLSQIRWFIRRKCMSYNFLKFPYTFAQFDEDVANVDWVHGTNSSIRRDWVLKVGMWDTHVKNQDEHSFAFKLRPYLKENYRLDFKKEPTVIRRMDINGGMDKRKFTFMKEWKNQYSYLKNIVFKYHSNFQILYPFQIIFILLKSLKIKL